MKRIITIFLALALLFLAGCDSPGAEEARTVDTARSFVHYYKAVLAAETADTIYYIGEFDTFIKYADKATGVTGFLCGRPDCKHNDENCNAYTAVSGPDCLFTDAGRLYWVCDSIDDFKTCSLYSAAPDGTDRREELAIDRELLARNASSLAYFILHEGCLYYGVVEKVIENGEAVHYFYVRAFPLDPNEESFEILRERAEVDFDPKNLTMQFYGNSLYIITSDFSGPEDEDGSALHDLRLLRWSAETRALETLYEDLGSPLTFTTELWVTDEGVYFDRHSRKSPGAWNVGIYKYDFETGECGFQFDIGVDGTNVGIADDLITGFTIDNSGGIYDYHIVMKDFAGNILSDETYTFDLTDVCLFYSPGVGTRFLGRDESYAYYAPYATYDSDNTGESIQHNSTTIIQVALDGSGAKELCSFVEDHILS